MDVSVFEDIGLTRSEIAVYLALLKLGSGTKKDIVQESKISSSKLYEICNKLVDKGLVNYAKIDGILHYSACPPEQVLDFIELKKERLSEDALRFVNLIPSLKSLKKTDPPLVEVYHGWTGMRTAYNMIGRSLKPGDTDFVLGASHGEDPKMTRQFFSGMSRLREKQGIYLKILYNKKHKREALSDIPASKFVEIRFLRQDTPSEINIWGDTVMNVILTKEPVVIMIHHKILAESYKKYFEYLWKGAEIVRR